MKIQRDQINELLIGCGSEHSKRISIDNNYNWTNLLTLDINADHNPSLVWDLRELPLPFEESTFDEIHAYEVLEHLGQQGDYEKFFLQFSEFYRLLKPSGFLIGTCPSRVSPWAWGDPSHTRIVQKENFVFLDQNEYTRQVGVTPMSDFRYLYKDDFSLHFFEEDEHQIRFALQAIKPSRYNL
ncbi:MAG: methyltransferase domain-containing protein [Thiotrichaceae bacterium]|nr:methyltransferase domain-containing protein [Thiotrichaceae bacterium]